MKNKHGLSRAIPSEVKRAIRQYCGFGCVICGSGIIHYEHVKPEFHDAIEHIPEKMALLCPQCHAKVTTGFWSKTKVLNAMKLPICKTQGFSREVFDIGHGHPALQFGGTLLRNCPIPIQVGEIPLFKIAPAEADGAPFRLSGFFCDSKGDLTLKIVENEWQASSNNWDVEVSGSAITIRETKGNIHLKLIAEPPNKIIVDRLNMSINDMLFQANGDFLRVTNPRGAIMEVTSCIVDNCQVGIHFDL